MDVEPTLFTQFSLSDLPPGERYPLWKESISVIFDVDWADHGGPERFDAQVTSAHLGHLLLVETSSVSQKFDRPEVRIRQDCIDHCLIQIYLEGGTRGLWGKRGHSAAQSGDVLFLDAAQPVCSQVSDFRNLTLLVPRTLLAPHLGAPERQHGRILSRDSVSGRLLGEHLRLLWQLLKTTPAAEAQLIGLGLTDLVGRYFGGCPAETALVESPGSALALRELIRAHIEQTLEQPDLSPERLAARFGLSRSTLFSLFKPLGGVSGYVQNRRLLRAHAALLAPDSQRTNITAIALNLGFKHPSHFTRAFRNKFGYSPRDVVDQRSLIPICLESDCQGLVDRAYERWVRELG